MTDFFSGGKAAAEVRRELAAAREGDARWNDLKNLRASYFAGDDVVAIATEAYAAYFGSNALYGAIAYPSLPALEAEVVAILLRLFQAPAGAAGSVTTGGTESIFMAVKTAREWARRERPASKQPTLILPRSGHVAFDKAAQLLGLRVIRMAASVDYHADVAGMAAAIDDDTIMIVGSAPPYPYGVVDPIPEIAQLAERHGLWLHVDACVGGMVLPFVRDLGHQLPEFDLHLGPVTSLSVDLHKYGYALHGCSALLLRDQRLTEYQRYQTDSWPVGSYATTNFVGSRSGGPVASAWAVLSYLGYPGYRDRVARMLEAKRRLIERIEAIPELRVFGQPQGTHFSFGSAALDIMAVAQGMNRLGWSFARQSDPPGMLLLLNGFHGAIVDQFGDDLAAQVEAAKAGRLAGLGSSTT
jgi:glutamate/tyrosine decarboxylase-like PLP-dependent enzyme